MGGISSLLPAAAQVIGYVTGYPMLGNIAGSAISAYNAQSAQEDTNKQNVALSREQMQFQERMSSSAWQRGVADMKAAGINPLLSVSQGPASSPSGSLAHVENAVGAGMSSALQHSQTQAGIQQMAQSRANVDLMQAQAAKVRSETIDNQVNTALALSNIDRNRYAGEASHAQSNLTWAQVRLSESQKKLLDEQFRLAQQAWSRGHDTFEADVAIRKYAAQAAKFGLSEAEAMSKFWGSGYGQANPYLQQIFQIIKGVFGARSALH